MKSAAVLSVSLLFIFSKSVAQDFTGVWTGFMYTSGTQVPYELVISKRNDDLAGYSLAVFSINGVENVGMKRMKVKAKKSSIAIEDDEMIYNDYSSTARRVILYCTLSLQTTDSLLTLQGPFFTRSIDRSSFKGNIRLQKKNTTEETRVMAQLKRLNLWNDLSFIRGNTNDINYREPSFATAVNRPPVAVSNNDSLLDKKEIPYASKVVNRNDATNLPAQTRKINQGFPPTTMVNSKPSVAPLKVAAAEINSRRTEVIRTVNFESDSLVLSLYDNGEVDGDTVSVVVNGQLVIAKQGLTTIGNKTTIHPTKANEDSLLIVMYAENLGRIAPNTGLLVIQDGEERYQVRFEGDLKKNSAVILRRKRPQ